MVALQRSRLVARALAVPRRRDLVGEPCHVDRSARQREHVGGLAARHRTVASDDPPDAGDVRLQALVCGPRRIVGPEEARQPVHRDRLADMHCEQREDGAFLSTGQRPRLTADLDLERTEHADLDRGAVNRPGRRAGRYRTATGPRVHARSLTTQGSPSRKAQRCDAPSGPVDARAGGSQPQDGGLLLRMLARMLTSGPYLPITGVVPPLWAMRARSTRGWQQ